MSRGPGRVMRAIHALLPTYESSRGLPAEVLAYRIYGRQATMAEVALVDRAAHRLVQRDLAGGEFVEVGDGRMQVYFRAEGVVAPGDAALAHDDDDGVVIVRSGPLVDHP